jgi:hypothetical protein
LGRWQQGDDEGRKTKEHGGGEGAESPNYRLGKWKVNRHLDPHDCHNDRFHHVMSPHHIRRCSHSAPECDLSGDAPGSKGAKGPTGKEGYRLKMPRRPIEAQGFEGWPANGFTTAQGTTRVRGEDGWAR